MPGKPSSSRSASTSGVINPRSSTITGSSPSSRSAARKTAAPGPGLPVPLACGLGGCRHGPVAGEAAEVVDPEDVDEGERPPQALDPPAVALSRQRVPVVERVAPLLPDVVERVGRCAGDEVPGEEDLRMGRVVAAAGGDVDRDVPDRAARRARRRRRGAQTTRARTAPGRPARRRLRRRPSRRSSTRSPARTGGAPKARPLRRGRRGAPATPRRPMPRRTASRTRQAD